MSNDRQDNLPFFDMPDEEGLFEPQLQIPFLDTRWAAPVEVIIKRDGRRESFDKRKIAASILRAVPEGGSLEADTAESIASAVAVYLAKRLNGVPASADQVSDAVERVLIQMNQVDAGLAYARYRDRRTRIRRLRRGDMRALLSELEEARQERGAGLAKDMESCRPAGHAGQMGPFRIVEACDWKPVWKQAWPVSLPLKWRSKLNRPASPFDRPVNTGTGRGKPIEHGLAEENDLRRRLGVLPRRLPSFGMFGRSGERHPERYG